MAKKLKLYQCHGVTAEAWSKDTAVALLRAYVKATLSNTKRVKTISHPKHGKKPAIQ